MSSSLTGVRVLCFYPWVPFEPSGSWTRFTCLWQYLLGEGASVTLAFLDEGRDSHLQNLRIRYVGGQGAIHSIGEDSRRIAASDSKSELRNYSADELKFLLMFEKAMYLRAPQAAPQIEAIIAEHDIVTCEYPMQAPLLSEFCRKLQRPLIVTSHDLLFALHGIHPGARERLKRAEVAALKLADAVVHCSELERRTFEELGVGGVTIPNTGDAASLNPGDGSQHLPAVQGELKSRIAEYCLFVGSAHAPNVEAAAEFRKLAQSFPRMGFIVAGTCHPQENRGNFIALGRVSEFMLDSLYRGAFAVVIPLLRGTGMSLKTFQALAYGKAVISTAAGARGLSVEHDVHMIIVKSPVEIAAEIRRLSAEPAVRRRLGMAARTFALEHDSRRLFSTYGVIINQLLKRVAGNEPEARPALILVDNHLTDRTGHHLNYARSIRDACDRLQQPFASLVNEAATDEVRHAVSGAPSFSQKLHGGSGGNPYPPEWAALRASYDFLFSNAVFARELESGLSARAAVGDVIFLPNATPGQMLGVALLLQTKPVMRSLHFVLLVRYSLHAISGPLSNRTRSPDRDLIEKYELAFEKLRNIDSLSCVRIVTDSSVLAEEYAPLWQRPVGVLPIPHTQQGEVTERPGVIPARDPGKLRIVFVGDAREEKGFELLPELVQRCAASSLGSVFEFVLQAFVSSPYHARMGMVIHALERLTLPNLHLVRGSLDAETYQCLLQSADIVLIPYDAATYKDRTSGPFVEAICADKPVVIPRATWMSRMLGESGAGIFFEAGDAQDLVRAVVEAGANIARLRIAASLLGKRFREEHTPDAFVKQLMGSP